MDLSAVSMLDFRTLNIGPNVTVIADQGDLATIKHIAGNGSIQASTATGHLDLTDKYVTPSVLDKDGNPDAAHGGTLVGGEILIGSEATDILTGGAAADRIEGGDGDDVLNGGDGNDVLRGGKGVDETRAGAGDDVIVVVGDLSGGGKIDSVADTQALGQPLTDLNGMNLNEDADGATEIIDGGEGDDTLYVYGTADLSNYNLANIEHIEIRSDVTFDAAMLANLLASGDVTVTGDGTSTIRLVGGTAADPLVLDLTQAQSIILEKIGQIDLGEHVILKISSLDQLGGARILTGAGEIQASAGSIDLPNTYSIESTLALLNADGSDATGGAEILERVEHALAGTPVLGTNGNDYLVGTEYDDIFDGQGGNDVFSGRAGDDAYNISGTGTKTILDKDGVDTLDLSRTVEVSGANILTINHISACPLRRLGLDTGRQSW